MGFYNVIIKREYVLKNPAVDTNRNYKDFKNKCRNDIVLTIYVKNERFLDNNGNVSFLVKESLYFTEEGIRILVKLLHKTK